MCNHDNSKKWQLRVFPPTALGNPVKFADPTGMEVAGPWNAPLTGKTGVVPQNGGGFGIVNMNWTYDDYSQSYIMSYGYSDFVVNGTNNSNDYFVNYALSGNAAYASSVTADHKNAIDWQIANASAKASESSWRGIWEGMANGFQASSYCFDGMGTVCLIVAPFTEGAFLPLSAIFYTAGTVSGLISDFINSGILLYYDDNVSGSIITFGVSAGFSLLMYNAPNAYKNELINIAEKNVKKFKTSMEVYTPYINSQVQSFNYVINGLGAALDKYFDTLNSYIPTIVK